MNPLIFFLFPLLMIGGTTPKPSGLAVGAAAVPFSLLNIDGKKVALADYATSKGVILVFTCNHCPYAVKYEDRVIALDKKYKSLGYPVVAINPNDAETYREDSYDNMKARGMNKGFTFPYLVDETQEIAKAYGAQRTPHVYILQREGNAFTVRYIGAIDNDTEGTNITTKYVEGAVDALLAGQPVPTAETKAIGCTIKWKGAGKEAKEKKAS